VRRGRSCTGAGVVTTGASTIAGGESPWVDGAVTSCASFDGDLSRRGDKSWTGTSPGGDCGKHTCGKGDGDADG
jgi:hypothetical protein